MSTFDADSRTDYLAHMKVKTSISMEEDLLEAVDNLSGNEENRSEFIEAAVQAHIARVRREDSNMKDLDIINSCADRLNEEALDVLDYQESL